ncbi:MAG: LytTR family transcriptional regulator [Lachnospiraceae bacterium]|nr:LytTR family transcriptional regulator [Lachnospiraceae bacterium]
MEIKTEISSRYPEPELHVCNHELNDEVKNIAKELHDIYDLKIACTDGRGNRCMLSPGDIVSVYAEGQKVMVLGENDTYTVSRKLYELEQELGDRHFVRISKSEIINIRKIKKLDMSVIGTIRIITRNGHETYVSRRNVSKIKEKFMGLK